MSAVLPLQKAVAQRWRDDAAVSALVGSRIYNRLAPSDAQYPYIRIGEKTEAPGAQTFGRKGWSETLTADVFTATHLTEDPPVIGDEQAWEIVTAMGNALDEAVTVEGWGTVYLFQEFATALTEANMVQHAPVRYRAMLIEE